MNARRIVARAVAFAVIVAILPACATDPRVAGCEPDTGGRSVARVWDEVWLDAIRRDVPAPTKHARNLFHLSVAMWDAWAAYGPAGGVVVDGDLRSDDVDAAREEAISYAAYRLLLWRAGYATGMQETFDELTSAMRSLCFDPTFTSTEGDSPAALGNRIGAAVIAWGADDGSNESLRYVDPDRREVNPPMLLSSDVPSARDPDSWQPLSLSVAIAQNGLPIPAGAQLFQGAVWGRVRSFGLPTTDGFLPVDPGAPPRLMDPRTREEFARGVVEVIAASATLDASDGAIIRTDPGALGDNSLGTDDGDGHAINPATGGPYAEREALRGDFDRALTEFWADGPRSETPPGHWNVLANAVSDELPALRIGGEGPEVGRLEWDVKLYLALNGALHDAAIAAWGVKRIYDTSRPITVIRWMASHGQSSSPRLPGYDPLGLPLVPGLIRLNGDGAIEVKGWSRGSDPDVAGGVDWIAGTSWIPYQAPTFVTPAFPGYVSGHSTFSRAGAVIMEAITGDGFFPDGLWENTVESGDLKTDVGPTEDVVLSWATYADAADSAGRSRIYGGIHFVWDDHEGRRLGEICGRDAWELALRYFAGGGGI